MAVRGKTVRFMIHISHPRSYGGSTGPQPVVAALSASAAIAIRQYGESKYNYGPVTNSPGKMLRLESCLIEEKEAKISIE